MHGFVLVGKVRVVFGVLRALALLEWEFPNLLAQVDGQVVRVT